MAAKDVRFSTDAREHMLRGVEKFCPIYTLCVGNAFGEAALLLSAGSPVCWMHGWGDGWMIGLWCAGWMSG